MTGAGATGAAAVAPGSEADPNSPENLAGFLLELAELTARRRLVLGGCMCCGSPYLQPLDRAEGEGVVHEDLAYDRAAGRYVTAAT
ncbi:hypothetical protein [Streptomyces sp. NBC_01207]|uniref:hypothetical protein n=1 Tax=Streptomyces sp. NBC_01207 TaxID=2903772 RepID=UPI002E16608E|nr:hypothetical protein OG457_27175 [Streptomyces sp. NBC_01207]